MRSAKFFAWPSFNIVARRRPSLLAPLAWLTVCGLPFGCVSNASQHVGAGGPAYVRLEPTAMAPSDSSVIRAKQDDPRGQVRLTAGESPDPSSNQPDLSLAQESRRIPPSPPVLKSPEGKSPDSKSSPEPQQPAQSGSQDGGTPSSNEGAEEAGKQLVKLSLDQAINLTILQDPVLRSGLEAINQANADALTSALLPNPQLLGDILMLPLVHPFNFTRQGGPPQTDYMLSYPIDWFVFGKRAAAMMAATQGVRVAEADYANLVRQRVTQCAMAYFDVLEQTALADLANQDVQNLERLEAVTRKAVELEDKARVDLQRIQLDLLTSRRNQRDTQANHVTAQARLRALLGQLDGNIDFELTGNLDAPLTARPLDPDAAFAVAEENRPDIESLRRKVRLAANVVELEQTKAYPSLVPLLGYTRQFQAEINQPNADSWNASLTMTIPIFDRNQGNIAKAQSVTAQSLHDLDAGRVALRAEIEQVVKEFRTALTNAVAVADEQLQVAREVRDAITTAYNLGSRPLIDVLDAQRNYRETYRLYITSRANYWRTVYRFNSAVGRQLIQ